MTNDFNQYSIERLRNSLILTFPDKDKTGNKIDSNSVIDHFINKVCKIVGGSSHFLEKGYYMTKANKIITEQNNKVKIYFSSKNISNLKMLIISYCDTLFNELNQETVAFELNNEFSTIYRINGKDDSNELSKILDYII